MVVNFDDIIVYSLAKKSHMDRLRQVFNTLRREQLFANPKKCNFGTDSVIFLGYVVSADRIKVDEEKI